MAPLQIAGKHDPGSFAPHFPRVNVSEREIVVASVDQRCQSTGCVRRVPCPALERGVQQADIEQPAQRFRVARAEIGRYFTGLEALAMNRDAQILQHERVRLLVRQLPHVVRQVQVRGELAGRVMVAANPNHAHVPRAQRRHLLGEKQTRRVVAPVTVVQVAGDLQQLCLLIEAQLDQVFDRSPCGTADLLDWCAFVFGKPRKRAIQMQIRSVHEFHGVITTCRASPNPSIPNSTTSPARRKRGGLRPAPTPAGVPVLSTSPGKSVMNELMYAISSGTENSMVLVRLSWQDSPFTFSHNLRSEASIASAVTTKGPIGANVSALLPLVNCPPRSF